MIGSYMLNIGSIEYATRELIFRIAGEGSEVASSELGARIGFIRKRFPREPRARHKLAMTTFTRAEKHRIFRDIVAHSAVLLFARPDGSSGIEGLMNFIQKGGTTRGELVSLEELRSHVEQSAMVASRLSAILADFVTDE